jgi:hypothetical protein
MADLTVIRNQRDRFVQSVALLEGKLRLIAERDQPPDYIVVVISDELLRRCGVADYFDKAAGTVHRDLRRAVKAAAMKYGYRRNSSANTSSRGATPLHQ